MSNDANWGVPYYNKRKPKSYLYTVIASRIASIDKRIEELQKEHKQLTDEYHPTPQ